VDAFLNINDPYTVVPQLPERPADELRRGAVARWIKPGAVVRIAGITLKHGNFYFGEILGEKAGEANDNPVVNPELLDPSGPPVDFPRHEPPSFALLPLRLKLEYIRWLAGGCVDRRVPVEFPLLYFYGLEHRLIVEEDGKNQYLLGEIRRLQLLFAQEARLQRDINRLFMSVGVDSLREGVMPAFDAFMASALRPSPAVLIHLGRRISHDGVMDAEDALLWLKSSFKVGLSVSATRCPKQFEAMFRLRFREAFPSGYPVAMTSSPLRIAHRMATWRRAVTLKMPPHAGYVADVEQVPNLLMKLRYIATKCGDELEPYSRYMARKGAADENSLEAISMLPDVLKRSNFVGGYSKVIRALDEAVKTSAYIQTDVGKFLSMLHLEAKGPGPVAPKVQASVASFLDGMGFGFEPDRRYGNGGLVGEGAICLFKAEGGGTLDVGAAQYSVARLLVELAVLAAKSDGDVNQREMAVVRKFMDRFTLLGELERRRLTAVARAIMKSGNIDGPYLSSAARLADGIWDKAVTVIMDVMTADGPVVVEEVRFLERLFKARKRPVTEVHQLLHRVEPSVAPPDADGLARIAGSASASGVRIPKEKSKPAAEPEAPAAAPPPVVTIDFERLARLKRETEEVSGILQEIFKEDVVEVRVEIPQTDHEKNSFPGLDDAHRTLMLLLIEKGPVPRQEFVAAANGLGVFPDGAIETINDWGFEQFDDAVIEDGAQIAVVDEMMDGLKTMMENVA
jgi:hypothetical protein